MFYKQPEELRMKKKILMVDDETDYTSLTKVYLEEAAEYEVQVVNDGKQAVTAAKFFKPDLLILDITMPRVSGLDIAKEIKQDEELKDTPIIFFTGLYQPTEIDHSGKTILGHVYLTKPTSGEKLLETIQKILGG